MIESYKESMMKTRNLVVACCLVGGLAGCANMSSGEQRTLSGAAIGTAAGALVGGLATGRPMTGAAIGAAAGAAGGWLYDRHERSEDR
jgi:osmotically inducible lipoprotein OsmB